MAAEAGNSPPAEGGLVDATLTFPSTATARSAFRRRQLALPGSGARAPAGRGVERDLRVAMIASALRMPSAMARNTSALGPPVIRLGRPAALHGVDHPDVTAWPWARS